MDGRFRFAVFLNFLSNKRNQISFLFQKLEVSSESYQASYSEFAVCEVGIPILHLFNFFNDTNRRDAFCADRN